MAGTSGSVAAGRPDVEYEVLCDDSGAFLRRYTDDGTGGLTPADVTLDGGSYTPVGAVRRCEPPAAVSPALDGTVQRQIGAGAVTIPAGARSVTLVVLAGTASVVIGSLPAVTVPAGTSLTWGVDQGGAGGEQLRDAYVFTGVTGSDLVVTSTREF